MFGITNAKFYVDKTHQRAEVTRNTAELGKEITGILFSADDVLLNEDNLSYDILIDFSIEIFLLILQAIAVENVHPVP